MEVLKLLVSVIIASYSSPRHTKEMQAEEDLELELVELLEVQVADERSLLDRGGVDRGGLVVRFGGQHRCREQQALHVGPCP